LVFAWFDLIEGPGPVGMLYLKSGIFYIQVDALAKSRIRFYITIKKTGNIGFLKLDVLLQRPPKAT